METQSISYVRKTVPDPPTVSVQKLYHSHRSTITMEIVCRVQSNPITSPTWVFTSLQGRVSNNSKEVDSVVKRGDDKDIISVVIINNPLDLHLGKYSCRAKNRLGEDSQEILVQGKDYYIFSIHTLLDFKIRID